MRRGLVILLALTIALGVFVSGCAQQTQGPTTPAQTPVETETETGTPAQTPATMEEVQIVNYAFIPSTITVKVGTTVQWVNNDKVNHTVTSDEGLFDSDVLITGSTFKYTFNTSGEYSYHCVLHPFMKGKVVVEE